MIKALEKDRNRRYETANTFAADVQCYLNDQPVQARPPSSVYWLRKFARRHKATVISTALVGLAILLGAAASFWKYLDEQEARLEADTLRGLAEHNANEAQRQTTKAMEAKQEAVRQRNAVYQNLYYADMRLGLPDWNAGNLDRLTAKLRGHTPGKGSLRRTCTGWEWYYLLTLCHLDRADVSCKSERGRSSGVEP